MRPYFLSKNKNIVYRSQDEYFPTFIKEEKAKGTFDSSKKSNHARSSSNLLEECHKNSLNIQAKNQNHFLPQITKLSTSKQNFTASKSIDQLQVYVHHLLLKNLKQYKENKQIKSFEKQVDKKKVDISKKEEQNKKEKESNRLQQLRLKLTQLYGEMTLQQNKLRIQYTVQEKMEKKYTNFYEHVAKRFKRNDLVDTAQNTQITTNTQVKQRQKSISNPKALSRFRVIGYAVLFSLFFPKYSTSFRQQRKKHYDKIINQQKCLSKQLNNCHILFQEIKLKSFWRKIQNKNGQSLASVNSESRSLSSNNSSEEEITLSNDNKVLQILKFILQNILQAIKQGKIDQLIKISTLSLSNRSYLTDLLFLSQQLNSIKVDKINNFILLKQNQQKILLTNLLLIKLTAFSFMMNNNIVSKNSQQYIFQTKQNGKYQNLSFTIAKSVQRAGLYLIDLCNTLAHLEKSQDQAQNAGNLKELQKQSLPLPMPQLKVEGKSIRTKRTSIEQTIKIGDSIQNGIVVENCEKIRKKMKKIPKETEDNLLQVIRTIRTEVYLKFLNFKRGYYLQHSQKALKYLKRPQSSISTTQSVRSPRQLEILNQLHLYLNKAQQKKQNKSTIIEQLEQDEISERLKDSQQEKINNSLSLSNQAEQNEVKQSQSRTQSR